MPPDGKLQWPDGARVAIALTFDVDGEAPLLGESGDATHRPAAISEWRYGLGAGIRRIRRFLADRGLPATCYVPGWVADHYPDQIRALRDDGHEIGHHGYLHKNPEQVDANAQRAEIEQGLEALERLDIRPRGYRAPYLGLTEVTAGLLHEHEFEYDSSCMGADDPYYEQIDGRSLLEIPVHWSLDDGAYLAWLGEGGSNLPGIAAWVATWRAEIDAAIGEGGLVTFMMHPHWTGRRHQMAALSEVIKHAQERPDVRFTTHGEVAHIARAQLDDA
jgi:peptidoglycan/xylan/chitin deacetylase (PgdA/CDA1 family)